MIKGKKVALLFICLNAPYWPYVKDVIEDCNQFFLTNHKDSHQIDFFLWSDIPKETFGATVIPTEPVPWPAPTLMRYHLFLNEEEKLKDYDYIFYMDADMRVVAPIGNEILGQGLTAAPHPGYVVRREYVPPYEPNPDSSAYISRLGRVVDEGGKPRFMPFYAAGGFQGGTAKEFLKAMKSMKESIDKDFNKNYVAIWNDESHWNKYLWNYKGHITFLDPSYVYPDSLIKEYYEPLWGRSYQPKIITLTKPFTVKKLPKEEMERLGIKAPQANSITCPTCGDILSAPGLQLISVKQCQGSTKPHEVESKAI